MTTNVDIHFSDGSNYDPRDDGDSPNVEVIVANIKSNVTNTNRDASASASAFDSDYGNAMKPKLGLPFGSANQGPEDEDKGEGCEGEDEGRRISKRGKVSTHCGRFRKSTGSRKNVLFGISVLLNILLSSYIIVIETRVRNNPIVSNAAVDVGRNRTSAHARHCHAKTAKNNKETTSGPSVNPSTSVLPSLKPSFDTSDPSSGPSMTPSTSVLPTFKPSFMPSDSRDPSSGPSMTPSTSVLPTFKPSFMPSDSRDPSSGPSMTPSTSVLPTFKPSFMPSDSRDPSSGPSANPSLARNNDIKILLLTVSSEVALDNEDSPQGKAFLWVSTEDTIDPPLEPGTADDARIIQRYVLVVFFYATGGDGWTNNEGWLGHLTECNWYGLQCNPFSNNLERLDLSSNQLSGEIPSEIGQLGLGLVLLDLSANQLSGPIPSQLGQSGFLEVLDLSRNDLTGVVPSQLGQAGGLRKYLHISAERMFALILIMHFFQSQLDLLS